jgi:hypothetical protein
MNVSLRPLEDRDLDTIYQQMTDPASVRMAAFTAEDQADRRAFVNRMSRLRADTSVSFRVIDVDGAIAEMSQVTARPASTSSAGEVRHSKGLLDAKAP